MTHPSFPGEYRCVVSWPVQWGDQDAYGHVNNTIYLRWFETGRIAYLERIEFMDWMEKYKIGPILAAVSCNFQMQLHYPNDVQVGSRITRIGRTSVSMAHTIYCPQLQEVVADGDSTIVSYDYTQQKPIPVPDAIRSAIEKLENRTF